MSFRLSLSLFCRLVIVVPIRPAFLPCLLTWFALSSPISGYNPRLPESLFFVLDVVCHSCISKWESFFFFLSFCLSTVPSASEGPTQSYFSFFLFCLKFFVVSFCFRLFHLFIYLVSWFSFLLAFLFFTIFVRSFFLILPNLKFFSFLFIWIPLISNTILFPFSWYYKATKESHQILLTWKSMKQKKNHYNTKVIADILIGVLLSLDLLWKQLDNTSVKLL